MMPEIQQELPWMIHNDTSLPFPPDGNDPQWESVKQWILMHRHVYLCETGFRQCTFLIPHKPRLACHWSIEEEEEEKFLILELVPLDLRYDTGTYTGGDVTTDILIKSVEEVNKQIPRGQFVASEPLCLKFSDRYPISEDPNLIETSELMFQSFCSSFDQHTKILQELIQKEAQPDQHHQ